MFERFPYPYTAAIAFSNDCEFLTADGYRFLENKIINPAGYRIKISNSLFFYTTNSYCHSSIGYFQGTTFTQSEYAGYLIDLIKSGIIDTIHAYGDFDMGGFHRPLAVRVADEISKLDLNLPIYTNHGTNLNAQNVGHAKLTTYQCGDLPNSPNYHTDLLDSIGVKYYWVDEAVDLEYKNRSNLIYQESCRDSITRNFFWRYRGLRGMAAPNAGSFKLQVTKPLIYKIIEDQSGVIFYQHFGVSKKVDNNFFSNEAPFFDDESLEIFELLSYLQYRKILWIPSVAEMLDFESNSKKVSCVFKSGKLQVNMSNVPIDSVSGLWIKLKNKPSLVEVINGAAISTRIEKNEDGYAVVLEKQ